MKALMLLLLFCVLNLGYYLYFRRKFVRYSEEILRNTRRIMGNEKDRSLYREYNRETLTSKVVMELEKTEDILRNRMLKSEQEKEKLQKTISEIAHQVKTPLSNICMYHDMLSDPDLSFDEAEKFKEIIGRQLEKLEFLIDSLIKSSRLESDMIKLNMGKVNIFQVLELAVNDVVHKADRKKLELSIRCGQDMTAVCDVKWTAEAIGNILDNAVKYTPEGGNISIDVSPGEMYTKIEIRDTGKGIASGHYNDIFKRFLKKKGLAWACILPEILLRFRGDILWYILRRGRAPAFPYFFRSRGKIVSVLIILFQHLKQD